MKTSINIPTRFTGNISVPVEVPINTGSRPVRRGNFWPGESFNASTSKWDLTGAFADNAFVLPALNSGNDPFIV